MPDFRPPADPDLPGFDLEEARSFHQQAEKDMLSSIAAHAYRKEHGIELTLEQTETSFQDLVADVKEKKPEMQPAFMKDECSVETVRHIVCVSLPCPSPCAPPGHVARLFYSLVSCFCGPLSGPH